MKILSFGEIIFDVYPESICLGGAPLNFAAHAVRAGAKAALVSAVGKDELGKNALEQIKGYGVETEHIAVSSKLPTGRCDVSLNESGVPTYTIAENVAWDEIEFPRNCGECDAVVFGTLALRNGHNRRSLRQMLSAVKCKEVFVDVNIRPPFYSKESICTALENATILKISDEDMRYVLQTAFGETAGTEEGIRKITAEFKNIKRAVVTLGENGSFAYETETDKIYTCGAIKTRVVSTVGAGDSFGATFLVNYLAGEGIENCLKKAAEVSAWVVSREGAIPTE